MKRRIITALTVLFVLLFTGCSQLLERSYLSVEKHYEQYVEADDSSVIEVSDKRSLESAIVYFVRQGTETGTVRARDYSGNITDDLTEICLSIQSAALGDYAIEYISHEKVSMVSYSEINIYFTYKKSTQQILCLKDVSYYNLEEEFENTFAGGDEYGAFYISYLPMGDDEVLSLVQSASDLAGISENITYEVNFYPDSGLNRIVELTVDYGIEAEIAYNGRIELNRAADLILDDIRHSSDNLTVEEVSSALLQSCTVAADAGTDAYAAVVTGRANSLGFARGVKYICHRAGVACTIVRNEDTGEYSCYDSEFSKEETSGEN